MTRHIAFVAATVVSLLLAACATQRAGGPPAAADPVETRQKQALVTSLLGGSAGVRRVEASSDRTAIGNLRSARRLAARAQSAIERAEFAPAAADLDRALALVAAAVQRVPDRDAAAQAEQQQLQRLLDEIDTFQASLDAIRERESIRRDTDSAIHAKVQQSRALLLQSAASDAAARPRHLAQAHRLTLEALALLVADQSFVYRPEFASPADELRFERERHAGYAELIPLALATLHAGAAQRGRIDELLQIDQLLMADIDARIEAGDSQGALQSVREATITLQRALAAAGAVVPQTIEE